MQIYQIADLTPRKVMNYLRVGDPRIMTIYFDFNATKCVD